MDKVHWYNGNSINISGIITESLWIKQNKEVKTQRKNNMI